MNPQQLQCVNSWKSDSSVKESYTGLSDYLLCLNYLTSWVYISLVDYMRPCKCTHACHVHMLNV